MTNSNQNNENFPKILYKYLPLKDLTHFYYRSANINTMLTENVIFFPDYRKLNDPSEGNNCNIILNKETIDKQENEHPLIKYLKLKFRILSLTKDCFNESMWDRYAGGYNSLNETYEGICIGFKTNNEVFKEAKKIEYVNKPKVKIIDKEFDELKAYFEKDNISYEDKEYIDLFNNLKEKIKESFFYKYNNWEKEKEYRIVKKSSFFIANHKKQLEFELIKCIFKKNNLEELIKNISEVKTKLTRNKEKKTICPYKDLKKSYKKFIHDISKDEISKYRSEWLKDENIETIYSKPDDIKNSKLYKKFVENISKKEFKKFVENTSKDKLFNDFISKLRDNSILESLFYNIIYDKNKNSNEVINKIIEEIYKMNENSRKKENNNYYNDGFFKYSHKEIACLITGCDLYEKILKLSENLTKDSKKNYEDFKNSTINLHKNSNNQILDDKSLDLIKDYFIAIPFISLIDDNNNFNFNNIHNSNLDIFDDKNSNIYKNMIQIQLYYLYEEKLKKQITEIHGKFANEYIIAASYYHTDGYQYHALLIFYYNFILKDKFPEFFDFFEERFNNRDINISIENIENYKNNPKKLGEDFKNFYENNPKTHEKLKKSIEYLSKNYPDINEELIEKIKLNILLNNIEYFKNNPEKLTEEEIENLTDKTIIENMSKRIAKTMEFISKSEPKNHTPSSIYCLCNISTFYINLNHFFNKQLEKINKKFCKNFKNIKFYKTIIGNGKIKLTNCITGKIIKNQEELEKDIEEDKKNKEPEVSLMKN